MKIRTTSQLPWISALALAIGSLIGFWPIPLLGQESPKETADASATPWTASDTRLANHYIKLLQKDPSYGNVFNLLWDLYKKKDQTSLLLEYFEKAAAGDNAVAKLLYAHLLRKNEQTDEAKALYDQALDLNPESVPALKALAEISLQQNRPGKSLSLHTRLTSLIPADTEEGIAIRLQKANLHKSLDQREEAVSTWNDLLRANPNHIALRQEIVSLLLEAGETETAIGILNELALSSDPRQKLNALLELNRLYEFINDFENAVAVSEQAMGLLHFRSHEYQDLFVRLIRIHERFDRLEELESKLTEEADGDNPTEKSLLDLAGFYHLTANPLAEESAVKRLVARLPENLDYLVRLTEIQIQNDHYEEAAETLETALSSAEQIPLHLLLLRTKIELRGKSRQSAQELLQNHLAKHPRNPDEIREILDFARDNYLDELVESLLRESIANPRTGIDPSIAPIELARFLHDRGRTAEAVEVLDQFAEGAPDSDQVKAQRYHQIALVLRDLDSTTDALDAINRAIELAPENPDYLAARADLYIDRKNIDEAISQLETIWKNKSSLEDKAEIDQRLFSLLRGHFSNEPPPPEETEDLTKNIGTLAQYRRAAAAQNARIGRSGDEPPPEELMTYYRDILETANEKPSLESRYRAAWWAFKLQDNTECYGQLTKATAEAGKPVVEVEKLLLRLAELNERPTKMAEHLTNLIAADPENADEYAQQKAEVRFNLGFEDEAIRELTRLAAKPEASLNTLSTLAKLYQRLGSTNRQLDVWRRAYREANSFEKRRIIKQLSTALIEAGKPEEALQVQLDQLVSENDQDQRHKQLDAQLTTARSHFLLDWLVSKYTELAIQHPFDRFFPEALARAHHAAGNLEESFEAMKKAYYMSGQSENLLAELSELADELGDLRSAIYYRRQLLNLGQLDDLENWRVLVDMLEKDLRVDEAELLRRRLETKFSTDPDFLSELTDHFLRSGQFHSARRTLERLVALRDWDLESKFRLGLLLKEEGSRGEALDIFESILTSTAGSDYHIEEGRSVLPLIEASQLSAEDRSNPGAELDPFIFTIEGYPFLGGDLQDDLADELQEPHPEFHYLPKDGPFLRLRAIEEAASLSLQSGKQEEWKKRWIDSDRPFVEKLWAARYSGATDQLLGLLNEAVTPDNHFDRLFGVYLRFLCEDPDSVISWTKEEDETVPTQYPRLRFAEMASLLLLKDNPNDSLVQRDQIFQVLNALEINKTIMVHLFAELRKAGEFESAYLAGTLSPHSEGSLDANFLFALSQVAGWAGRRDDRERYLDQSLDVMMENNRSEGSSQFLNALSEKLSLLEDDPARLEYVTDIRRELKEAPLTSGADTLEREVLISITEGNFDRAAAELADLLSRQIEFLLPQEDDPEQSRFNQSQGWQRMSRLIQFYSDRIPFHRERGERLVETLVTQVAHQSIDPSALSEFEQFQIDLRSLRLDWIPAPERQQIVQEIYGGLSDRDSGMELGKSLENQGYYREAVFAYEAEALREDRDYAPFQGLFEACMESLVARPALQMIARINTREFSSPPGLTVDYLNEQHSQFLLINRDLERLLQLSHFPPDKDTEASRTAQGHLPYLDALVEAYRLTGENDSLLRLLSHLRNRQKATDEQLYLGADTLMRSGRNAEALDWLADLALDGSDPKIEKRAMLAIAKAAEATGWAEVELLREVAEQSLTQQPPHITRQLADSLARAGKRREASGILKLLHRKTSDPLHRTITMLQLLKMDRASGIEWADLSEEFGALFHDFTYHVESDAFGEPMPHSSPVVPNAGRLVEWLVSEDEDREGLIRVLNESSPNAETMWLQKLVSGYLNDSFDEDSKSAYLASTSEQQLQILETLPFFGEIGIQIAKGIVETSSLPGTEFFRNEPRRQLSFFTRIEDRARIFEVVDILHQESKSDIFHQYGLDSWYPTLSNRTPLPRLLSNLGETSLAANLFEQYHKQITRYEWNHQPFLDDYIAFLIETGQYDRADSVLRKALRKSIRVDLRLLMEMYRESGHLDEWEELSAGYFLTAGQMALLRDWRTALAEGREMVEYTRPW
ncbi:MAG: hypothetical protein CMO55_22710 [Verrucomicrobiales bacterium]|nr:hypothetical protein [Verrucomicrobiales bacterium]